MLFNLVNIDWADCLQVLGNNLFTIAVLGTWFWYWSKSLEKRLDEDIKAIEKKTEAIERRTETIERKTEAFERKTEAFERRAEAHDQRLDQLYSELIALKKG